MHSQSIGSTSPRQLHHCLCALCTRCLGDHMNKCNPPPALAPHHGWCSCHHQHHHCVLCKEDLAHSTHSYIQQLCFPWWRLFLSMQGASADYWLQTLQASKISTSAKHNTSSTQIHIQILMFITNTNKEGRHHKYVARIENRSQSQRGEGVKPMLIFEGSFWEKRMVGGWDYFGIFSW